MNIEMGRRLRAALVEVGMKAQQMAEITGKSRDTIHRYMRGDDVPKLVLEKWAHVTGKPLNYFRGTDEVAQTDRSDRNLSTVHPGVETLSSEKAVRRALKISDEEITRLRQLNVGKPILSLELAWEFLRFLRMLDDQLENR